MFSFLKNSVLSPHPIRGAALSLAKTMNMGSYSFHLAQDTLPRPNYAHIIFEGAKLAKRLAIPRISVIEFGVAGGNGLISMEYHAAEIEKLTGVTIDIYGFDTGEGLPPPRDFRDLPYHWKAGYFKMDQRTLRDRLVKAKLIVGDVKDTLKTFMQTHHPAPIAAISHDFDYYSSTSSAFDIFAAEKLYLLPRIFCYFDDIVGTEVELYNEYTGQLGAIAEYNKENSSRKLASVRYFVTRPIPHAWHSQIFVHHDFEHPLYNTHISEEVLLTLVPETRPLRAQPEV